jgi:predicted dehydrogenase
MLTYGMVGGGQGAFIGAVHRMAISLDNKARLVAGALSSTPGKARDSALQLGIPPDRAYGTWKEMLDGELKRPAADRINFVSIVTPNDTHFEVARAFAAAGFNVVCDKPLVHTSAQANELIHTAAKSGVIFAVTYNYSGYPMVKQAASLVRSGKLGTIRKVFVEYHQGWLATNLESEGQKQADWRTDPTRSGAAGAVGDIGTHAENLVATITGLEMESLCADLTAFVPGRKLDDDAAILIRYKGGAKGTLTCSQVCVGEENNLSIRVYGSEGMLSWRQEEPNALLFQTLNHTRQIFTRSGPGVGPESARATRLPSGHPEAFIEAFANIYRGVIDAIIARESGTTPEGLATEFPTIIDGARGVHFIEAVVRSARSGAAWTDARFTHA